MTNEQRAKGPSVRALTTVFAGGNLIAMGLRLAAGFMVARLCAPQVLGLFNGMALVLGYLPILHLGVLNGLNRELPFHIGAGEHERARSLAATAQAWALLLGGLAATALLGLSAWQLLDGHTDLAAGWFAYAGAAFALFYGQQYLQVTYRTRGDFSRLAMVNVTQSVVSIALLGLVWLFGFYGLCARTLTTSAVVLGMLWLWRPLKIKPRWQRRDFNHLFKIGAPIFAADQVWNWWILIDSTLVLRFFGTEGLGLYQLARILGQGMEVLPVALGQICYPRMVEEYGRTGSLDRVLAIVRRPVAILVLTLIPIVLLIWFALPPAVELLLPNYVRGIPAAQWVLWSAASMSLASVCDVFTVIKRLGLHMIAIIVGCIAYAIALWVLSSTGLALESFPQAMLCGRMVYILFSYAMLAYFIVRA